MVRRLRTRFLGVLFMTRLMVPDFYYPYEGLREVAQQNPENMMLQGRGLPGTHDIALLEKILSTVSRPSGPDLDVSLPIFDKSQHAGYGDRSTETIAIREKPDVFVLEGWSLGFRPLASDTLASRWKAAEHASRHSLLSVTTINRNLKLFADKIYGYFDVHVSLSPTSYDYIYAWRTQQEHTMKATNGGKGMTDEEVVAFVDRYMPVYELFGDTTDHQPCLTIHIGPDRSVMYVE